MVWVQNDLTHTLYWPGTEGLCPRSHQQVPADVVYVIFIWLFRYSWVDRRQVAGANDGWLILSGPLAPPIL